MRWNEGIWCFNADKIIQCLAQISNLPFKWIDRAIPPPTDSAYLNLYERIDDEMFRLVRVDETSFGVGVQSAIFKLVTILKPGQQLQCLAHIRHLLRTALSIIYSKNLMRASS
mgnify:CR=1 FL=1|jgi:hypothetical protein